MTTPCLSIKNMTMAYGDFVIQRDLDFTINRGDILLLWGEWLWQKHFVNAFNWLATPR